MKKTIINIIASAIATILLSIFLKFTGFETVVILILANILYEMQDIKK